MKRRATELNWFDKRAARERLKEGVRELQQSRQQFAAGEPANPRQDKDRSSISADLLAYVGNLTGIRERMEAQDRIGQVIARHRGEALDPNASYASVEEAYDYDDPDINLEVIIEHSRRILPRFGARPARVLLEALEALKAGVTLPVFRPRKKGVHKDSYHLNQVRDHILRNLQFRRRLGMTSEQAYGIVAELTEIPTETIKSWNARLPTACQEARQHGATVRRMTDDERLRHDIWLDEYSDDELSDLGKLYARLKARKKRARPRSA
jgi:hypothetical protein